jgi:phosphoserine phosphatase RsbU/P
VHDGAVSDGRKGAEVCARPWEAARLEPLRTRVAAAAGTLGADAADRLVLASFEAATNVVRHVAPPFHDSTLSCRIMREASGTVVEVWYLGEAFRPTAEPQPDFSGGTGGGFGRYSMSRAVGRVTHESPLAGMCCTRLAQSGIGRNAA